jgi:hypothetical protein
VVFIGEVDKRTGASPAMKALDEQIAAARNGDRSWLRAEQATLRAATRAEKTGEVVAEFDGIHDTHRAVEVGSVDGVILAAGSRPEIIAAIEEPASSAGWCLSAGAVTRARPNSGGTRRR